MRKDVKLNLLGNPIPILAILTFLTINTAMATTMSPTNSPAEDEPTTLQTTTVPTTTTTTEDSEFGVNCTTYDCHLDYAKNNIPHRKDCSFMVKFYRTQDICTATMPRYSWYYEEKTNKCIQIYHSTCDKPSFGMWNFETKDDCDQQCVPKKS